MSRFLRLCLVLLSLLTLPGLPAFAQGPAGVAVTPAASDPVAALLARLTPEQKIGQLFLTSFAFDSAGQESDIYRLIAEQHVGGVVLLAANGNFRNDANTPLQIANLTNELQTLALDNNSGIPLFVAADHEGDGFPYQRIIGGMTSLPNPMAIGATWDPANARATGEIAGRELAAIGVNLLLGPDVDVLSNPRPTSQGDIGTRTFGGDPWWVAQMGRSYVCGVHQGSGGRVATVAKHFPGHGGSDRLPDQEVATVDKSLGELKRIELPPFFAVTQAQGDGDCAVTEAMMTSHIRYRGLQGNIRQFTAPISFDGESLASILGLGEFAAWLSHGLMVSDALGVPAVARYFDPSERTFPHRQIAKEALMAGNDLLTISEFARPQAAQLQYANLVDTINYFREEYQANALFRQRVEEAVGRVLRVKLKLYGGEFTGAAVHVDANAAIQAAGKGGAVVNKIAGEALTELHPNGDNGRVRPAPPRRDENILIFTDAQLVKDCPLDTCDWYEPLATTAVQDTILRLYGPAGSGQVDPERLRSVSFLDLKAYLESRVAVTATAATATPPPAEAGKPDIGQLLNEAQWIIFAMRDANRDSASSVVRLFLDNGISRWYETRVVVLAFNAPYYLDTTEINKLTLYLAAYSKTPPFVEAAVRALFGEFRPTGHSPVNVEGLSYDLLSQVAPDPARPIPLTLAAGQPPAGQEAGWQAPTTVRLQAGPVIDRNGNRVPDGTEVIFEAAYESGGVFAPAVRSATVGGQAEATIALREPGSVVISASSGEAHEAQQLRLAIQPPPTVPLPTKTATSTPQPTPTPTATASPSATPGATAAPSATPGLAGTTTPPAQAPAERALRLLLALLGAGIVAAVSFLWLAARAAPPAHRWRGALLCFSGGLAAYLLYHLFLRILWPAPGIALLVGMAGGVLAVPLVVWQTHRPARHRVLVP